MLPRQRLCAVSVMACIAFAGTAGPVWLAHGHQHPRQAQTRGSHPNGAQEPLSSGFSREHKEAAHSFTPIFAGVLAFLALMGSAVADDTAQFAKIAPCLLQKCQAPLAKCLLSPNCAANLTCILGCQGQKDIGGCEVKCGDFFENDIVQEFNRCALNAKSRCVPQRPNTGEYPVPPPEAVTPEFDITLFDGAWYISAGLNELFDTFPCQVHFFVGEPPDESIGSAGRLNAKINWRVPEPDGEFFSRSTVQRFIVDKERQGVLYNHNNEYLHYEDDWYILDHANENDKETGFILVYYRGRNDAWDGYGGAVLYTRAKTVPESIVPRLQEACQRAGIKWEKFVRTDNSCPKEGDSTALREQFLQRQVLQAQMTAAEQLTQARRFVTDTVTTDERLLEKELNKEIKKDIKAASRLEQRLEKMAQAFSNELQNDTVKVQGSLGDILRGLFHWRAAEP